MDPFFLFIFLDHELHLAFHLVNFFNAEYCDAGRGKLRSSVIPINIPDDFSPNDNSPPKNFDTNWYLNCCEIVIGIKIDKAIGAYRVRFFQISFYQFRIGIFKYNFCYKED